jgi:hypothetical protein
LALSLDDLTPEHAPVWRRLRELSAQGDREALEASCRELCGRFLALRARGHLPHETLRLALRLFERTGSADALAVAAEPGALSAPSRRFLWRRYRRYLRDDFPHRAEAERRLSEALLVEPGPAAAAFRQLAPAAPDGVFLGRLLACSARVPAEVKLSYFRRIWHRRPLRRVALEHLRGLAPGGDAAAASALATAEAWGARRPRRA